jgi:hypothetical protein
MFEQLAAFGYGILRRFRLDTLRQRWDALIFSRARGDYYEYLADMVEGLQGRKTLRDLFDDDAHRYGNRSVRGRLARRWSQALEASGGDLAMAWKGSMPPAELALVHAAQDCGASALTTALRDLARAARVMQESTTTFRDAVMAGLAALAVALALAWAVPYLTVPRLQAVFDAVPPPYYGRTTRGLFAFAEVSRLSLPAIMACAAGGIWVLLWSLPNLTGPLRTRLDRWSVWRLYRDVNAIRFLAMLAVLVSQQGNAGMRLRSALTVQAAHAGPWLAWHIDTMVSRIDAGMVGPDSLDTGLMDRRVWWYLSDMVSAHGMACGLARAVTRVESRALRQMRREAQAWRWTLLLGAVMAVVGLALWHYAAVDDLRRAMTNVYAAR